MLNIMPPYHLVGHIVLLNYYVVKTFSHLATRPGKKITIWFLVVEMLVMLVMVEMRLMKILLVIVLMVT